MNVITVPDVTTIIEHTAAISDVHDRIGGDGQDATAIAIGHAQLADLYAARARLWDEFATELDPVRSVMLRRVAGADRALAREHNGRASRWSGLAAKRRRK